MPASRRLVAAFARQQSGSAAVEFAIVAPALLAMLLGIIAFGSYLGVAHSLQTAASESARAAVAGLDPAERIALATSAAQRSVVVGSVLRADAVTIEAKPDDGDPNLFTVTLRYDLKTTLLNVFPRSVPLPQTLSRSASIRRGGL
ncbi:MULTISPECIES: TadE/TadG family type IV pilus assembly protein [Methylobacterium]|uniref:Flp pilus assembly protein TadG n=2 Tax=Methylobacterium TaxID=407 RepID=A0A0C6FGK1_9HYPH|nr:MULTISPECIES: TadE/TadG family type IV pilus assembly protein [Methylobacterium]MBZ6416696.1 pilus assembly protein [Methylobacterium sp.]MBK3396514.1 pilus assembly protein [Methylobacterium ajmalii]MBK3409163.1 pilus assembly protein [Methylobacterium ajmalii]MBK3425720.1 pilus assembly protein [Methylobacterium ajmalii]SFE96012.1 Flp pilus assembly protein TadG [Methylobacterium sp. yr596]